MGWCLLLLFLIEVVLKIGDKLALLISGILHHPRRGTYCPILPLIIYILGFDDPRVGCFRFWVGFADPLQLLAEGMVLVCGALLTIEALLYLVGLS